MHRNMVLVQLGEMRPVQYCSKVFSDTQQKWHCSEQEIYAVIYALDK